MINFSIIVPHKDSVKYLLRLLDSIPNNDDIQVIIVDDNSSIQVVKQLQNIELKNNIDIVFCDISKGAGGARNIGLSKAKGKWILFADADDYFSNNFSSLTKRYRDSECDIIYFGTDSITSEAKGSYRHERYMKLVVDYLDDKNKEDALKYYFTPPWGKMISRELIEKNNIQFDEVIASNDVMFSIKTAYFAKNIEAYKDKLYMITLSKGSTTNIISLNHFDSKFRTALKANNFLCSIRKKKYQHSVLYFIARSYKFGFNYFLHVTKQLIINRSNLFIGIGKLLNLKETLSQRENKNYITKKIK
jgi:glycosyltransferase involved in cell wall biosynthesis|tara:strand:+ start:6396 stop:7307 length:912 start_codon:yes stop_codon:yes gene_type:complete